MPEMWGDAVGKALAFWMTGEKAKTHVLQTMLGRLDTPEPAGSFEELAKECIMAANDGVETGRFPRPADWLFAVSCMLDAARILDQQGVLAHPAKLLVFRGLLKGTVDRLGSPTE